MKSTSQRRCGSTPLWLLLLAVFPLTVHCADERFILSRFYDVSGGKDWLNNSGWKKDSVPLCSWYGIQCFGNVTDNHGVIGINLASNNLDGRVAKLIYTLPQLRSVDVQKNPGITDAGFDGFVAGHEHNVLEKLMLAQCSINTLKGLKNAPTSLKELHLTGNELNGKFPKEILALTTLEILYLSFNKIRGTLPTEIGKMSHLKQLYLYQNALTGQLPTELGKLTNLQVFTMAENILSGTLPTELNRLTNLKTLSFHNKNDDAGTLGGPLLDFADLTVLSELYLDGNDLSGIIPPNFLKNNNNTETNVDVGLTGNQLTGSLPLVLNRFKFLDINLVGNSISLIPVSFCDNHGWMSGLVNEYGCNAILCEVGSYNEYGRQMSDETPCVDCSSQTHSDYWGATSCGKPATNSTTAGSGAGSGNSPSPSSSTDVLVILGQFYQNLQGGQWFNYSGWSQIGELLKKFEVSELDTNANFTAASVCKGWTGITCDNSNNVIQISLPQNGLVGTLPTELGSLSTLKVLDVSANQAVTVKKKEFWKALAGSTNLKTLNLADTNINDLTGIGEASHIEDLTLDGVYFARTMPTELFKLTNLKSLHMQYNVITGPLPTLIGRLSNLKVLNFYDNELSGPLPTELGLLTKITVLDLSENKFNSSLPTELQRLTDLSQLHLHQTFGALSGTLPSFSNFHSLFELTLDSNILTGTIPKKFLQDVTNKSLPMYVGLSFNRFKGTVPSELSNFSDMELLIEGNNFTEIATELCQMKGWMEGEVGRVGGCDAIGCSVGTWNIYGKASAYINASCEDCPSNPYVGQTYCTNNLTAVTEQKKAYGEVKILDMLYDKTNGPNWTEANNNWTAVGVPLCSRSGVKCSDPKNNAGVLELDLFDFGLRGRVPSSIFSLPSLRKLRLNNNSVEVDFRGISNATNLQVLQLSSTHLHNLEGLGDAGSKLTELHLAFNDITGSFPSEILNLTSLKQLFLQQNQFSGSIPPEIEKLGELEELYLEGNILSGPIPPELGSMTTLRILALGNNYLSGDIPPELNSLSGLTHLDLQSQQSENKLVGSLPSFNSSSKLTFLKLGDNKIAGSIPSDFIQSASKTSLVTVDLSQNELTGAIPTELGAFGDLYIDLTGNRITGLPDTFCDKTRWMNGLVGNFRCDAILCSPGTYTTLGRHGAAGGACQNCSTFNSTTKKYYGQTECLTSDETYEREVLQLFYIGLNGSGWYDNTNWLSDKSVCTWYGVGCDSFGTVVSIVLDTNNLVEIPEGSHALFHDTPSKVLSLPNLQVLDLRGNEVRLNLTQIANASSLQNLTLSSTNLTSLKGIGKAQKLQELHVTDDGLAGTIPDELFSLTNLKRLYMSFNGLSGTLSGKLLGNLSNLEEFYMFGNNMTGTIPTEVGALTALREFIMPANFLNGTIPTQFSSLSQLEQLSLYDQQGTEVLSGTLPTFANAKKLWYFDVSNNGITGRIPDSFLKYSTFRNSSLSIYLSNNDITGTIPEHFSEFSMLDIRLEGNRIEDIPPRLCAAASQWMGGAVATLGCDAILCHKGSYNSVGRRDSENNTCLPCQSGSPYVGQTSCVDLKSERAILSNLYDNTNGAEWTKQAKWKSQDPVCSWEGVLCKAGRTVDNEGVTGLFLAHNNLQGTLPSLIWSLPLLESMNLQSNKDLRVTMEGFSSASNLETLILNGVKLDTVAGVSSAAKLKELHITDCQLTGTFPDEIFNMGSTLEGLYLAFNSFYGTISTKIGQLTNLKELFAYDNDFSGAIPTEIGQLTRLIDLVLAENLLSGSLPEQLSSLPNIQVISLYRREKPGPKLSGNLTAFDKLPRLTDLFLDHNDIQGTIPPNFLTASVEAQNIILSFNKLSGTIPLQIGFLPALDLELEGNQISGFDPSFCDKSEWMLGQVAEFECDAILCPPRHAAEIYGRAFTNSSQNVTCEECHSQRSAPFFGSTTCRFPVDVKTVLTGLYNTCNGKNWIYQNLWTTTVDVCNWDGIGCNDRKEVTLINLSANNLTGTIPDTLFQIPTLEHLWLHSNPISFKFPSKPLTTNLQELRLDNTGLATMKGISKLNTLVTLHLEHNLIQGQFSYELFQLTHLRALYLGDNGISGTFPANIQELSYLNTLSLRDNGIEGGLPSFEEVRDLTNLDLCNNKFTGTIPSTFFDGLSSFAPLKLELSGNTLSGTVPTSLSRFHNLTIFLRDNLFDAIPSELCAKGNWNGGDVAKLGCDAIMCPPMTYSPLGRAHQNTRCVECSTSSNFGQSNCASAAPAGLRAQRWVLRSSLSLMLVAMGLWAW